MIYLRDGVCFSKRCVNKKAKNSLGLLFASNDKFVCFSIIKILNEVIFRINDLYLVNSNSNILFHYLPAHYLLWGTPSCLSPSPLRCV